MYSSYPAPRPGIPPPPIGGGVGWPTAMPPDPLYSSVPPTYHRLNTTSNPIQHLSMAPATAASGLSYYQQTLNNQPSQMNTSLLSNPAGGYSSAMGGMLPATGTLLNQHHNMPQSSTAFDLSRHQQNAMMNTAGLNRGMPRSQSYEPVMYGRSSLAQPGPGTYYSTPPVQPPLPWYSGAGVPSTYASSSMYQSQPHNSVTAGLQQQPTGGWAPSTSAPGRTVDELFSSQQYRQWAGSGPDPSVNRQSRWASQFNDSAYGSSIPGTTGGVQYRGSQLRSSSLPPRQLFDRPLTIPTSNYNPSSGLGSMHGPSLTGNTLAMDPMNRAGPTSLGYGASANRALQQQQNAFDRLHVSPVLGRRGPNPGAATQLRTAGPGWNADEMQNHMDAGMMGRLTGPQGGLTRASANVGLMQEITGILVIHILEGRGLRVPVERSADELYCVLEVDSEHRARTGVSTLYQNFRWHETFEIDVIDARQADIYVYSWHPQFRHKLCHRGSLKLLEAFVIDRLNGEKTFALTLEPKGQLLVRIGFIDMNKSYQRSMSQPGAGCFGLDLVTTVQRENTGVDCPLLLRRLIDEVERRGVDANGIYLLCGSTEKKRELRYYIDKSPLNADVSADTVPDTNVLTSLLKDYLRELPEPVVPGCIYQMLVEASSVAMPNDRQGNVRLLMGVIDCMPRINKCTFMILLDHFKSVTSQSPHNGLSLNRLSQLFGPLVFCASHPQMGIPPDVAATAAATGIHIKPQPTGMNHLNSRVAAQTLAFTLELWPGRVSSDSDHTGGGSVSDASTGGHGGSMKHHLMQQHRIHR